MTDNERHRRKIALVVLFAPVGAGLALLLAGLLAPGEINALLFIAVLWAGGFTSAWLALRAYDKLRPPPAG